MLYFAINQPKFFAVIFFSEVYLSLIMVRDYRYFVICYSVVAVFMLYCYHYFVFPLLVILSISEISLYCFLSIWGSIFYQQFLLDKNIKRHCVR